MVNISFSNLVFLSKEIWYTPKFPLLKGTKREKLLQESKISEADISVDDLYKFESAGLINAIQELISLDNCLFHKWVNSKYFYKF